MSQQEYEQKHQEYEMREMAIADQEDLIKYNFQLGDLLEAINTAPLTLQQNMFAFFKDRDYIEIGFCILEMVDRYVADLAEHDVDRRIR